MSGAKLILAWIVCVILGGVAGFFLGYLLWKLGFELIGSAVALVGADLGGIMAFIGFMSWSEEHRR